MAKLPDILLPNHLRERLAGGHPWVYRNHIPKDVRLPAGSWVRLRCASWRGFGLWEAHGPIAIRIFSERYLPDTRWLEARLAVAWELRAPLRAAGCTAYRWLFGESDGIPGITIDLYGDFAVIQTYMESASTLQDWLVKSMQAIAPLQGIVLRTRHTDDISDHTDEGKIQRLWGDLPHQDYTVIEHGILFHVDIWKGQKTGLFLDHRENRHYVETVSQGKTVLNCFAYTGAFSLYALRGGAQHVTSVDSGKGLAEAAERNIQLNQLDQHQHDFITSDCFELLNQYVKQERTFDVIILDPPSFAKSKQSRHAAMRAYAKLNALAMRCISPGGLLVTASCTSQVSPAVFREILASASANADRRLQIIHEAGQPLDHPILAAFPEGRYLKFVVGRVIEQQ
ncbi:MAG: class I SAM-dependent rRNA methyltransferase [Chloroflexi bacterium AL-W]|nr:class I SAM-dependent rRNA methyltransferase [Chloroflexi bacterium AL-N1]NOK65442.1 class I SAM-dependent rRNA methyltransferase [Chloroflexi bacterium AL-N10]NOK72292.1 class I SAM-dependent rRNA methyltransferase [Chloroflexi bacterium AL-N5]NOK79622.1 class I SAM-dependent rRNA methyltransferase [Chloroflexi bacterium AL-W]NOK87537.1 class I SAM-dependent rRNA methyltransferase [Chloroflexi bacterium AL-N15]